MVKYLEAAKSLSTPIAITGLVIIGCIGLVKGSADSVVTAAVGGLAGAVSLSDNRRDEV